MSIMDFAPTISRGGLALRHAVHLAAGNRRIARRTTPDPDQILLNDEAESLDHHRAPDWEDGVLVALTGDVAFVNVLKARRSRRPFRTDSNSENLLRRAKRIADWLVARWCLAARMEHSDCGTLAPPAHER